MVHIYMCDLSPLFPQMGIFLLYKPANRLISLVPTICLCTARRNSIGIDPYNHLVLILKNTTTSMITTDPFTKIADKKDLSTLNCTGYLCWHPNMDIIKRNALTFSRGLFSLNFHWLVELFSIVLIGHCRYLRMVLRQSIKNS